MDKKIRPNNHDYVDGVVKLHELLSSACQEAYGIAKKCIPNLSEKSCRVLNIFVDFSEEQPDNALKGYFVFDKILFRFLTITFDYALLFPANDHVMFDSYRSKGITFSEIDNMIKAKSPYCFSFSPFHGDEGTPKLFRFIKAYSLTEKDSIFYPIKDEVGCPFTLLEKIEELCLIDVPQRFSSVQYTLVGKQYYAPYSTDKESYCVLYAEKDNEHESLVYDDGTEGDFIEDPRDNYLQMIDLDSLKYNLSRMKRRHRDTLLFRYVYGLKCKEIADIFKISERTVKIRCSEARVQLKKMMEEDEL